MKRTRGFSLLEILAALVLLSLVLLGVYSGIRTATRIVRSGDVAIERIDQVRSAQQFLRRELAQAVTIAFDRNDNGDGIVFSGGEREIRFVAPLPGYLGAMGAQLQTWKLVDDDNDDRMRLEASFALLPPDGSEPKPIGEPEVLVDGIHKGSFAFRGFDKDGNPIDWQAAWDDGRRTPSLVRIDLDLDGGVVWPTLDAPLRVDPTATVGPVSLTRGLRGPGFVR
jgi:general secretion pathway protein J